MQILYSGSNGSVHCSICWPDHLNDMELYSSWEIHICWMMATMTV